MFWPQHHSFTWAPTINHHAGCQHLGGVSHSFFLSHFFKQLDIHTWTKVPWHPIPRDLGGLLPTYAFENKQNDNGCGSKGIGNISHWYLPYLSWWGKWTWRVLPWVDSHSEKEFVEVQSTWREIPEHHQSGIEMSMDEKDIKEFCQSCPPPLGDTAWG